MVLSIVVFVRHCGGTVEELGVREGGGISQGPSKKAGNRGWGYRQSNTQSQHKNQNLLSYCSTTL